MPMVIEHGAILVLSIVPRRVLKTLCSPMKFEARFEETFRLRPQDRRVCRARTQHEEVREL
jgi:hypothetical protein